jgi:hypothetical protein
MSIVNDKLYGSVLKVLAFGSAVIMMFISAQFSVDGFSIQQPNRLYIGWLIAAILIIIELIFNYTIASDTDLTKTENKRLVILLYAGGAAYLYGIATNVIGIIKSGATPDAFYDFIVPVALGIFLEVVPEPLMVWAWMSKEKPKKEDKKDEKRIYQSPKHQQAEQRSFRLSDLEPSKLKTLTRGGRDFTDTVHREQLGRSSGN